MQKIELTQEKLCTLREKLPWGAQKRISERIGVTVTLVNKVLNGHWQNDDVIAAAFEIIEEEEAKRKMLNEKIDQL